MIEWVGGACEVMQVADGEGHPSDCLEIGNDPILENVIGEVGIVTAVKT